MLTLWADLFINNVKDLRWLEEEVEEQEEEKKEINQMKVKIKKAKGIWRPPLFPKKLP